VPVFQTSGFSANADYDNWKCLSYLKHEVNQNGNTEGLIFGHGDNLNLVKFELFPTNVQINITTQYLVVASQKIFTLVYHKYDLAYAIVWNYADYNVYINTIFMGENIVNKRIISPKSEV
jgi:hypothetical protein